MNRLLSMGELKSVKGISYSRPQLYRKIANGSFVKPIRLGPNRIAFLEKEVDEWIDARAAERGVA